MPVNNPNSCNNENEEECSPDDSKKRETGASTDVTIQEDENTQTKPNALLSNIQIREKCTTTNDALESLFKDATSCVSFSDPEPEETKDQNTQVKIRKKVKPIPSHEELSIKQSEDNKNVMPVLETPLSFLSDGPPEVILLKDFGSYITPEFLKKCIKYKNNNKRGNKINKSENKTKFKDSEVDILLKSFISEDFSRIYRSPIPDDNVKNKSPENISSQTLTTNSFLEVLRNNLSGQDIVVKHKESQQEDLKPIRDSLDRSKKDSSTSMKFTVEKKPSRELLGDLACQSRIIEQRRKVIVTAPDVKPHLDWNDYYRLANIHAHMETLEYLRPSLCTTFDIGESCEGRKLKIMKISNSNATNASVWMDAGIHGREWIAPAVAIYVIHQLSTNFPCMENFMTNKDWYILPVMNPDGYEYSHTMNRMWRKNRSHHNKKSTGVDLNRNFSVGWGKKGSSNDPDSQNYHGPGPFSEAESSAVRDMLQRSGVKFDVYLTLHCYAQLILFPYSHTADPCPDYNRLLEGATIMSRAIFNESGKVYKVGTSKELLNGAAGTSADWSYEVAKIPYCYTIELRSKEHRTKVASANRNPTQVWEVSLVREGQRYFLKLLDIEGAINIWKEKASIMDIMVEGPRAATVAGMLHEHEIPYTIAIKDVDVLRAREQALYGQGVKQLGMDWTNYHRLGEIYQFLHNLESQYPYLCRVIVIGRTTENRDIKMLKISNGNKGNVGVWIDGGIHAREWITPAAACYVADQVVRRFDSHPQTITDKDWYILPVMNPDGYEYTFDHDRMWRKNRTRFGEVVGVDLNRNFSYGWGNNGEEGSSADPNSVFHRGPSPFSEPETRAVRKVILESGTKFKVFISLHSYGEVIIFPWGYTGDPCPDYVELLQGGSVMARAIKKSSNHIYKVGSMKDLFYDAAGSSIDWSYGYAKIPSSFIIELRDKTYKFLLPKEQIASTCQDAMHGVFGLLNFVDNKCENNCSCTSCISLGSVS